MTINIDMTQTSTIYVEDDNTIVDYPVLWNYRSGDYVAIIDVLEDCAMAYNIELEGNNMIITNKRPFYISEYDIRHNYR